MGAPKGPRFHFPRVKEARQALADATKELIELQIRIAKEALAAQDFESANNAVQFLLEHAPEDEDGTKVISSSVDVVKEIKGNGGPTVQIGIAFGPKKELPPAPVVEVIDVTDDNSKN